MNYTFIDSNVVIDILSGNKEWHAWSEEQLAQAADESTLAINPVVYAEVSIGVDKIEDLEEVFAAPAFVYLPIPKEAAFLAGKAFLLYKRRGGSRSQPLPDFFIGAHATALGCPLLTRDPRRYREYFPRLKIIAPE